jgi:hypothetical protein
MEGKILEGSKMTHSTLFSIFDEIENQIMTGIEKELEELEKITS